MRSVSPLLISLLGSLAAACAPDGSSAYVSRNVPLNTSCEPADDDNVGIATGVWDVGSDNSDANCVHSYLMSLSINSTLKTNSAQDSIGRAEPNTLLITHVDVRLMDKNQGTLGFVNDDDSPDTSRPNPYRLHTVSSLAPTTSSDPTTGVVQIEAIPRVYAEKLAGYTDDSILLEIQVFGTTTGDVDIDFRPFLYPLRVCAGCLSRCRSEFTGSEADLTALKADKCDDNGAQDDRYCIDSGC